MSQCSRVDQLPPELRLHIESVIRARNYRPGFIELSSWLLKHGESVSASALHRFAKRLRKADAEDRVDVKQAVQLMHLELRSQLAALRAEVSLLRDDIKQAETGGRAAP